MKSKTNKPKPRVFVAECTAGCQHNDCARQLEEFELAAHDDKHLPPKVRVLVRMLRDAPADIRQQAINYMNGPFPAFAKRKESV